MPILEAAGVLEVLGVGGDSVGQTRSHRAGTVRERPADVLLCREQDLRTGTGAVVQGRVALDVGVVCPQAAGHLRRAAAERLGAAEGYVKYKCGLRNVEERCRAVGVTFQPKIFESLGGVSAEAERVIKCLDKAVADNTDAPETEVATLF